MCRLRNIAMHDYKETATTGQMHARTDGRTDRRRTKWSLCAAMLQRRHNKMTIKFKPITIPWNLDEQKIHIQHILFFPISLKLWLVKLKIKYLSTYQTYFLAIANTAQNVESDFTLNGIWNLDFFFFKFWYFSKLVFILLSFSYNDTSIFKFKILIYWNNFFAALSSSIWIFRIEKSKFIIFYNLNQIYSSYSPFCENNHWIRLNQKSSYINSNLSIKRGNSSIHNVFELTESYMLIQPPIVNICVQSEPAILKYIWTLPLLLHSGIWG